jgi:hypothetical protein
MRTVGRYHCFLALAGATIAVMVVGSFWTAPFRDDAVGIPRVFFVVWNGLSTIPRFFGLALALSGVNATISIIVSTAIYVGLLVALDRWAVRCASRPSGMATERRR